MFNFQKPEFTDIDAYIHYKTDGIDEDRELIEEKLYPGGAITIPQRDHVNDLYESKTKHINAADEEEMKALVKKARRLELKLGICKTLGGRMQRQYDYVKALEKQYYKDKGCELKKVKPVHDYLITISFDDTKLFDKKGNIKYNDLVKIMKSIQGYKWIKTNSDFERFKYQIEQRGKPDEPIYGLHVHIIVRETTHQFRQIIDALTKPDSLLMNNGYIDDSSKIQVDEKKYDRFDDYISDENLKKKPDKRLRQVNDRILQIEYNKYVKDPMIKSIVVPQQ